MRFAFLQEPPFCFTDASGALRGCDAVLAEKVCETLGLDGFSAIEAEFAGLLPGLAANR
ncbi:MAG: transporter substrate-binding domain-containing protein, partial [Mesorhizobium sp.]